jgi:putative endonuclease
MCKPPPSNYPDIGDIGEDLVVLWLQSSRFSCRWE